MIIKHQNIEYTVSALDGWNSHLYSSLSIDVLYALAKDENPSIDRTADLDKIGALISHTIVATYSYFTQFCLSTKASRGTFSKYNLSGLQHIPRAYQEWLKLFAQPGFFDEWLEAYNHENKEEEDQKKGTTGE